MDKRFPHPFSETAKRYREYRRKLPDKISVMAVEEIKGNFKIGGYRGGAVVVFWKKRSNNYWGKTNRKGRALLIKSGRLKRGIRKRPTFDYARVVNDVPYAQPLNDGFSGTIIQKVKAHNRKSKSKKAIKVKAFKRKIMMKLPARPFMIVGEPFYNILEKEVLKDLETIFLKA
jgi:phage gpG-like protein